SPTERGLCTDSRSGFLMACRALLRSWRRRVQIRPRLHHFIMTTATVAMKRLLISHDGGFGAAFKLDLWYLRQKLRLRVGARVTVSTDGSDRVRIFVEQLRCQSRGSIRGPNGFVRR